MSPTEKVKPTMFLDWEPSVKKRIGLENELTISWRWERWMEAEVEFFGLGKSEYHFWRCEKLWRSRGENRSEAVEFEIAVKRVSKVMAEAVIFNS